MAQEIWKPIKGYENLYEVSSLGNVKSLSRLIKGVKYGKEFEYLSNEKLLKQHEDTKGYYRVKLYKDGVSKTMKVHRLVAESFLGDIIDKQIDHINTIKSDNRVENLRIVNTKENCNNQLTKQHYSIANKGKASKKVRCIFDDGTYQEFNSITEAVNSNFAKNISGVSQCCNGKIKTHNKLRWEFVTN